MTVPPFRHVFIDLDDTLWDFKSNSYRALKVVYDAYSLAGYYPRFDDFYRAYSEKNAELWNLYHHGRITRDELIAERFRYPLQRVGVYDPGITPRLNQTYLSALSEQIGLYFYARELLAYLSAHHYTLTLLSNGFREVQYKKLDNTGLRPFFDHIVLSDEVGFMKPHPGIFTCALGHFSAAPAEAIMIGDNFEADIRGAARVGIAQIYFNPDNKPLPPLAAAARPANRAQAGLCPEQFAVGCPPYRSPPFGEIPSFL